MLGHPRILEHFCDLGLEVEEAVALFCMLAQEDGGLDMTDLTGFVHRNHAGVQSSARDARLHVAAVCDVRGYLVREVVLTAQRDRRVMVIKLQKFDLASR